MRTLEEAIDEETRETKKSLYLKFQKKSGLKAGDKVKVLRKAEYMELGWNECWLDFKDKFIGKTFTITKVTGTGIVLKYRKADPCSWHFPYFILEKVPLPTIEFLMPDETWEESECNEKEVRNFTLVTKTDEYDYYHHDKTMLYRVSKE